VHTPDFYIVIDEVKNKIAYARMYGHSSHECIDHVEISVSEFSTMDQQYLLPDVIFNWSLGCDDTTGKPYSTFTVLKRP